MRIIKKILVVPLIIILELLRFAINLLIKAECWVAGVGFLLLAIFAVLAVIKRQWIQVGMFIGTMGAEAILLLLSVNSLICIDFALEKVK